MLFLCPGEQQRARAGLAGAEIQIAFLDVLNVRILSSLERRLRGVADRSRRQSTDIVCIVAVRAGDFAAVPAETASEAGQWRLPRWASK